MVIKIGSTWKCGTGFVETDRVVDINGNVVTIAYDSNDTYTLKMSDVLSLFASGFFHSFEGDEK